MSIITVASNTETSLITTGLSLPTGVSVTPDGTEVFITENTASQVSYLPYGSTTISGNVTVGSGPYYMVISNDGLTAYVVDNNVNEVSVFDVATKLLITTISDPSFSNPIGIAILNDDSKVYVANAGAGTVSVIDTATNLVTTTVGVGSDPQFVAIAPASTAATAQIVMVI